MVYLGMCVFGGIEFTHIRYIDIKADFWYVTFGVLILFGTLFCGDGWFLQYRDFVVSDCDFRGLHFWITFWTPILDVVIWCRCFVVGDDDHHLEMVSHDVTP